MDEPFRTGVQPSVLQAFVEEDQYMQELVSAGEGHIYS
jgi:hypothetical protein